MDAVPADTVSVIDMEYIYILDYKNGFCEINTLYGDPEEWLVFEGYDLNNIHWMVTKEPNLRINI